MRKMTTSPSDKVDWEVQYRALLKQELAGQEQDRFSPWSKPSGQVYLPRTLLEEQLQPEQRQPESESRREGERPTRREGSEPTRPVLVKVPVAELWKKLDSDRVLLLEGPAGMGKTTWSTHLVQEYLEPQRPEHQSHRSIRIPIRIVFRDFMAEGAEQASVKNYLTKKYDRGLGEWLYGQWGCGQAVLILDGLDEVVDSADRTTALENLLSMGLDPRRPLTMLTSRPLGQSLPLLVTAKIELQGLSPQEQIALITLYQSEFTLTDQQIEQFLQRVGLRGAKAASSSPVRALFERPGHLVHLLRVYAETGQVLETETEVLTHLLEKRLEFTGRSHPPVTPDDPGHTHKKRLVLETMAFHLLACRQGAQTRAQILALLGQVLQEHAQAGTPLFPPTQASSLLTDFVQHSGLLTRVGLEAERYQVESVIWLHHMAGSALANRQIVQALNLTEAQVVEFLDKKAWDPEWEPVLTSWMGQADNPFPLFERLIDKTQDDLARHRLGAAGRCLFEVNVIQRERPEYQSLSVQIPTEAFEVWKAEAKRGTEELIETSLRGMWEETEIGKAKLWKLYRQPGRHLLRKAAVKLATARMVLTLGAQVLGKLSLGMTQETQQTLVAQLVDSDINVRWLAVESLERLGPRMAPEIQQALIAQLVDSDIDMRWPVARVLGALGPWMAEPIQAALMARLEDLDKDVRSEAARALGKLGPRMAAPIQQALVARLVDSEWSVRGEAAEALGSLGPKMPEPIQQALVARLADSEWLVRELAVGALGCTGFGMAPEIQQALVVRLADSKVNTASARALSSAQQQGLRFFLEGGALCPGRLLSELSATPLFSDGCVFHQAMRRSFALVSLDA